ncbi:MAG: hypothetical protein M1826_005592 [Phylliscum demangeonii]|nr:MAG: hypothetical protein M1826_005592 [Phylliscum demangeonii]
MDRARVNHHDADAVWRLISATNYKDPASVEMLGATLALADELLLPLGYYRQHRCDLVPYPHRLFAELWMRPERPFTTTTEHAGKGGGEAGMPLRAIPPYFSIQPSLDRPVGLPRGSTTKSSARIVSNASTSSSDSAASVPSLVDWPSSPEAEKDGQDDPGLACWGPFVCLGELAIDAPPEHIVGHHVVAVSVEQGSLWLIDAPLPDYFFDDAIDDDDDYDGSSPDRDAPNIATMFSAAAAPVVCLAKSVAQWSAFNAHPTELPLTSAPGWPSVARPIVVNAGLAVDGRILPLPLFGSS